MLLKVLKEVNMPNRDVPHGRAPVGYRLPARASHDRTSILLKPIGYKIMSSTVHEPGNESGAVSIKNCRANGFAKDPFWQCACLVSSSGYDFVNFGK